MPNHSDSPLHRRVLIAAFEGWSDAASATSTALDHLSRLLNAQELHVIGADGYTDYQVHRPRVSFSDTGERVIEWPETRLAGPVTRPGSGTAPAETIRRINGAPVQDIFLLAGVEPSRDWTSFTDEILDMVDTWGFETVIILGSMFSDAPHSRPITISLHSESSLIRSVTGATRSAYSGPAGITSVLDVALTAAGIHVVSVWAQVPHYVHNGPSPKATLALLDRLEELLDVVIPRGELLSEATEWESHIDRIAAGDEEMSRYIRALEVARDTAHAPEATGEAIAHEFEKFLSADSVSHFNITVPAETPVADITVPTEGDDSGTPSVSTEPDNAIHRPGESASSEAVHFEDNAQSQEPEVPDSEATTGAGSDDEIPPHHTPPTPE